MDGKHHTQGVGSVTTRRSADEIRRLQLKVASSIIGTHKTEVEDRLAVAEVLANLGLITTESWRRIYAGVLNEERPVSDEQELPRNEVVHVDDTDRFMGYDVNDFTSSVTYGIFNDPDTFTIGEVVNTEALRERLFKLPLMEDDDPAYVQRHAQLSNEDRARNGKAERVKVRRKTILETPWVDM